MIYNLTRQQAEKHVKYLYERIEYYTEVFSYEDEESRKDIDKLTAQVERISEYYNLNQF